MASLERTAYPTLPKAYSKAELQRDFSFSDDEIKWVRSKSKAPFHLNLAVLLKTFQVLRYFPDITDVPNLLVDFIRGELGQRSKVKLAEYKWFQQYRHMNAIRARLGVMHSTALMPWSSPSGMPKQCRLCLTNAPTSSTP
jgi:hypothetical protein